MRVRRFLPVLLILSLVAIAAPALWADTLNAALVSSTLTGTAGGMVTFQAALSNTSGSLTFLYGDSSSSDPLLTVDDTPFQPLILPPSSIVSGALPVTIDLFHVLIDPTAIAGKSYSGDFFIFAGGASTPFEFSYDLPFTVDVTASNVPEPGTLPMLLLGAALAGGLSLLKLRSA